MCTSRSAAAARRKSSLLVLFFVFFVISTTHPILRNQIETDLNQWLFCWHKLSTGRDRLRSFLKCLFQVHCLFCVHAFLEMAHYHVTIITFTIHWKLVALKMLTTLPDKGSPYLQHHTLITLSQPNMIGEERVPLVLL